MSEEISPEEKTSNTSKYFSNFMYKTLIVTIFIVIIPLFPSQAPEFINQTVSTRSWELLHLLFVGIAVSYGLFSRRKNDETDNVSSSKFENAQSYVSRFLQVSSVFDDDTETPTGLSASSSFDDESNKVQTWRSQYFRGKPVVVVAQESSVFDEQRGGNGEKPLLLPVRSLKSRVSDAGVVEYSNDGGGGGGGGVSGSLSRSDSNSGSKRFSISSRKTRVNGESRGVNPLELEENLERNVVLPSPIPWRSRSGRMEMKEQVDGNGNGSVNGGSPLYTQPPAMEESEFFNRLESRSFKSQTSRSSKPNSLSSSQSSLFESQNKNDEDLVRKKSFHKSSVPPPPPPPPPPPMNHRTPLTKSYSSTISGHDWGQNGGGEDGGGMIRRSSSANESKSKAQIVDTSSSSSLMGGKYIRTIRGGGESFGGNKKFKEEVVEDEIDHDDDKQEVVEKTTTSMEKTGKKSVKFDQTTFFDFQRRNRIKDFMDQVIVETDNDDDSETEDDNDNDDGDDNRIDRNANNNNNSKHERDEESTAVVSDGGGPDVDKKADEFIAKFREQIRLQRIASIKKSSGQNK